MKKLLALLLLFGIVGCGPEPINEWEVEVSCNGKYTEYAQCRLENKKSECDKDPKFKASNYWWCRFTPPIKDRFIELNIGNFNSKVYIECDNTSDYAASWNVPEEWSDSRDSSKGSIGPNIPSVRQYFQYCGSIETKEDFERELRLAKFLSIPGRKEFLLKGKEMV